jgi:hypothetical protein
MKKLKFCFGLMGALSLFLPGLAEGAISISTSAGSFPLVTGGQAAPIFKAAGDSKVVGIAADCLAGDVEKVSGVKPQVSEAAPAGAHVILIGTIGKSPVIDSLIAAGKVNATSIQGKWESFLIQTVDNPIAGVEKALVIAGSDRRGAAFGAFDISEGMGVSPWVWWADVVPAAKSELWVSPARYEQGPPAVKYRGIFLNDEDWALQPWAAKTYEPEVGDVGPKTYAKICELLLRLRANYLWPAMHPSTRAFNHYPQNKLVADDYAIVMGASHAEPMLRNNVDEWDESVRGAYNYVTNRANVLQYWDERAQANGAFENIYTIGMRGIHDSPMEGGGTTAEKVARLESIFADQRQILANRVNPDPAKVPQVFVPYKEVLDLYKAGLRVPDDVTIMWPDDNHGYIRQLPTPAERARGGGSGIYYHISYWGTPNDYLWLCTTPPALIWSEMSKAYDYGARQIWVLNVGDIKPGELCTQFFIELARDPEKFRNFDQLAYLKDWAGKTFGAQFADSIGTILDRYYRLNHPIKPEHLNITSSGFSHVKNGDEAERRLQDFAALAQDADALQSQIPAQLRSAYFELVLYPVRGTNLMNRKVLLAERSRLFAQQKRKSTATIRTAAVQAYNQIATETTYYNTSIEGGKWNWMMHWHPRDQSVFTMPATGNYTPPADGPLGIAIEGSARTLDPGDSVALPPFSPYADGERFIDVFGTGNATKSWTATASVPWIKLSKTSGTTTSDSRVLVGIDWAKAPRGFSVSSPVVISDGASADREINVTIYNPPGLQTGSVSGAVERNGTIEIEAENYNRITDRGGVGWKWVKGLGASRDAVSPYPAQFEPFEAASLKTTAPLLEYDFYTFDKGALSIQTASLPTYPIDAAHQIRFAIAVNDETPQIVVANAGTWDANVLRAAALSRTTHSVTSPGKQTLKLWAIDPTTVVDKFTITAPSSKATTTTNFETENLVMSSKTANITYRTFDEAPASGGKATVLESSSNGQFVTLAVPFMQAGTYDLIVRAKKLANRGIVQLAISDNANGPFTNTGATFDLYNGTDLYADVPAIRVTFAASGTKYLRFSVAGRGASATSSWICLDALSFNPVSLLKAPLTINQWRENFFGTGENTGQAADDADWDGDGDANLVEYAAGTYPTEAQSGPRVGSDGDSLVFRFTREAAATGVLMSVDACDSPAGPWESIWSSQGLPSVSGSLVQQLQAVDPVPLSKSSRRFYRLRVSSTP